MNDKNDFKNSDYYVSINRIAVSLEPTEAYLEWTNNCFDDDYEITLKELQEEPTVYLIPEVNIPETWLKQHYSDMFDNELWSWCTDETLWPADRSFKTFKRFFHIRVHTMIIDMDDDPIIREEI